MGEILIHNPWVQFYLLYVGALVVINVIDATVQKPEPAGNTSAVGLETKPADSSRNVAA